MKKDFLFPITLFFVFFCSSIIVLLFAANVYESVVEDSNRNFETGTSLAYITEKIRQSDSNSSISLSEFDGYEALKISESYIDKTYITYIYEMDGVLKEIYLQEDTPATANAGTTIMTIKNFDMESKGKGLIKFTATASDGTTESVVLGTYSN